MVSPRSGTLGGTRCSSSPLPASAPCHHATYVALTSPTTPRKDLDADLLAILDSLSVPKAFIVAKDFRAMAAYNFSLLHPDRVSGVVTLGIPFVSEAFSLAFTELPEG
ncbi:hypothetical protein J5N97_000146 [Dioscorea zingiberensis]|uniref:Uncharacterized protein n=1 Tax=Dioscorea zingiberensis TaxID=325984 RepID=A0A9D5BSS0_9LILI|nr:hypothetical protein J5N97_000146 [Dioscorea zingiberensis]